MPGGCLPPRIKFDNISNSSKCLAPPEVEINRHRVHENAGFEGDYPIAHELAGNAEDANRRRTHPGLVISPGKAEGLQAWERVRYVYDGSQKYVEMLSIFTYMSFKISSILVLGWHGGNQAQ